MWHVSYEYQHVDVVGHKLIRDLVKKKNGKATDTHVGGKYEKYVEKKTKVQIKFWMWWVTLVPFSFPLNINLRNTFVCVQIQFKTQQTWSKIKKI